MQITREESLISIVTRSYFQNNGTPPQRIPIVREDWISDRPISGIQPQTCEIKSTYFPQNFLDWEEQG